MISIQELDNPTQLKDLDYICELAEQMLSGRHLSSGGSAWRTRVKLYREMLQRQIAQAEAKLAEAKLDKVVSSSTLDPTTRSAG